jgi:heat shock protein HslJ
MRAAIATSVLAGLALASGCGNDAPTAGGETRARAGTTALTAGPATTVPTSQALDVALDGREFVSSEIEGRELVHGSQIRLTFNDSLSVSSGCNYLDFNYWLDGDRVMISGWGSTAMACKPAALMEQEDWLASFLTAGPTVALDGDTLTLTGHAVVITLLDDEVAEPDRDLEGTTWVLEGLINAPAVSSVPHTPAPTLRLAAGKAAIDTGCNAGRATYHSGDGRLNVGPIRLPRSHCTSPDGNARETAVLAVLEGASTYEIEGDVLTITKGDTGLTYRATDVDD